MEDKAKKDQSGNGIDPDKTIKLKSFCLELCAHFVNSGYIKEENLLKIADEIYDWLIKP